MQKLNFDGCYLAHYTDRIHGRELVLRSHMDAWPFFYCIEGDKVIFSDDFYALVSRFKELTLNRDSIADYFEAGWNNIIKWDRTPFKEIHMLPAWTYITDEGVKSWKKLDSSIKFTEHNLEEFKRSFFECTDYYLKKVHDNYGKVIFSVSAGMDSTTLAARYVKLYPENDAVFYTSKIDDVTDESGLALKMESVLHKPVRLVNLKTNTFNYLELLKKHIDKNLPPRFNGLINEGILCDELFNNGLNMPDVNGMGADGRFGEFGGEYLYLMRELLADFKITKAYRVYKAVMISFIGFDYEKYGETGLIVKFLLMLLRKAAGKIKRKLFRKHNTDTLEPGLLKISLPPFASSMNHKHKDAIEYASQSGEVRDINIEFSKRGIKAFFPYAGYRLYELSAACDPFIFSDGKNKACVRYASADLLPQEIINNVKKKGNPAMTLQKALNSNNNLDTIMKYVKSRESRIVNTEKLYGNLMSSSYGQKEFLSLCLLIFEEKITEQMGITINV